MPTYSVVVRIEMEMEVEADTIEGAHDAAEDAGYDVDWEDRRVITVDVVKIKENE